VTSDKLQQLLEEYTSLETRKASLSEADRQRAERLRDVLLEVGAVVESEETQRPARVPRAPVSVEVVFSTPGDAVRAYTKDIGVGGFAISTRKPMPKGSTLQIQVRVPGWDTPLAAQGEVVWTTEEAMGIAFQQLSSTDERKLKQLIAENTSLISRLRSALSKEQAKAVPARVQGGGSVVALQLGDEVLADVTAEVLGLNGYLVYDVPPEGRLPEVVVADPARLSNAVAVFPGVPLIAVNASGPEAFVGRLSSIRPALYVKRPASAAKLLEAVRAVLRPHG